ncbi:hypothetical protein KL921_002561 [Ogataea angusta]|nr:hypothetical protein KL921_002561 [Ogataea angusta]KAG7846981.1 hypothetical protein KL941_002774 [Ogataea angusta]
MLVPLLLSLAAVVCILLLGDLPVFRNTFISLLHSKLSRLLDGSVSTLKYLDSHHFNGKLRFMARFAGWAIPAFYIVVYSSALWLFAKNTLPLLPKNHLSIVIPSVLLNYYTFSMAVLIDPGSKPACIYPFDEIIYTPSTCRTCKTLKPARSKHCSTCDRCVQLFDHHCVWLNNDVGYYTYRYFLTFLASKVWTFTYGAYLCWIALATTPRMFWHTVTKTNSVNKISGALFLLCILLLPLVAVFLAEHLRYIYLGVTTNETAKWDYIRYLFENRLLYRVDTENGCKYIIAHETGYTTLGGTPVNAHEPKLVRSWKDLQNVYDKGFVSNLVERVFPKAL